MEFKKAEQIKYLYKYCLSCCQIDAEHQKTKEKKKEKNLTLSALIP